MSSLGVCVAGEVMCPATCAGLGKPHGPIMLPKEETGKAFCVLYISKAK